MSTSPIDPRSDDADDRRREADKAAAGRQGHVTSTMNHADEVHGRDAALETEVLGRPASSSETTGAAAGDDVGDGAPAGWWPFGTPATTEHPKDDTADQGGAAHVEDDGEDVAHPEDTSSEGTGQAEDGARPEGEDPAPGGRHHAVGPETAEPAPDDGPGDGQGAGGEAATQSGADAMSAGATHGVGHEAVSGEASTQRAESDDVHAVAAVDDGESGIEGSAGSGYDTVGVPSSGDPESAPEHDRHSQRQGASDGQDDADARDTAGAPSSDGAPGAEDAAGHEPTGAAEGDTGAGADSAIADADGQADEDAHARAMATDHSPTHEALAGEQGSLAGQEGAFHVEHDTEADDAVPVAFHVEHPAGPDAGNDDDLPAPPPFHVQHAEHGEAGPGAEDPAADAAPQPVPPPPLRRPRFETARIMAVANQKGGVGKTTTAVSLAAAVAETGAQVLLVDLDPQGNASSGLGMRPKEGQATIYHVLVEGLDILDAVEPANVRNLFVVPTNIDLAGAEVELVSMFSREQRLRRALESVVDEFDLIIIDCPPSLGLLTVNALTAADGVIVPIQCEYYALEGLGALRRNADLVRSNLNPELEITGFVLTMLDARTRLSQMVVDEVKAHFGDRVFRTRIPRSVRLAEAPSFGQPITVFDPGSRGAMAYRRLAAELLERLGAQ